MLEEPNTIRSWLGLRERSTRAHPPSSYARDGYAVDLAHIALRYSAIRYADRLADAGALASIGTVGDSFDNAPAEFEQHYYRQINPRQRPLSGEPALH
jgi:hypothetical protein